MDTGRRFPALHRRARRAHHQGCRALHRRLADPGLGYAFLPAFAGQGFAREAGAAVLQHGLTRLGLPRLCAIVTPGNQASIRVLGWLGMYALGQRQINDECLAVYSTEPPADPGQ